LPERWLPGHDGLACTNPLAYMPFGDGARRCVGMKFALQEARLALAALYSRHRFELAPWQVGRPLATVNGLTLSAAEGVWVTPVPRASAGAAAA
jgi:cytochrome P450